MEYAISFPLHDSGEVQMKPYLHLEGSDFLLVGCRRQEAVHLTLKWVVHFHVNVIACGLLLIVGIHAARGETQ